ncbi:MAG: AAA family ATPase [Deltaproteobacteria bacterium]|nr:AAA family ATPase [Deltaproteobacteria bacterium]
MPNAALPPRPAGPGAPRPPWAQIVEALVRQVSPALRARSKHPGGPALGVVVAATLPDGLPVALRALPPLNEPAQAALSALCRRWATVEHPAVCGLLAWPCAGAPEAPLLSRWAPDPPPAPASLGAAEVATLLIDALDGLAALHAAGLRHGGIGPRALRRRADGGLCLLDPGLGRVAAVAQTESHAAPEGSVEHDVLALLTTAAAWLAEAESPLAALLSAPPAAALEHAARAAAAVAAAAGLPAPVPRWPAAAPQPAPPGFPAEGEGGRPLPLLGRHTERAALWTALLRAAGERRPLGVVLQGAPGEGRSALLSALCSAAEAAGLAVARRALHGPVWGPGQGLSTVLRTILGVQGLSPDALRPLAAAGLSARGLGPEATAVILRWLGAAPGPMPGPLQRYDALLELLRAETRGGAPAALLWIDDAQWGRDALCFALHLFARAPDLPALVVVSVRAPARSAPPEPLKDDDVQGLIDRLLDLPEVGELRLGSMGQAELVGLLRGPLQLAPGTAQRLADWARGTPLPAVQAARALQEAGLLVPTPEGRALAPGDPLPADLEAVWLDRVQRRLQPDQWGEELTLSTAALLGGIVVDRELDGSLAAAGQAADRALLHRLQEGGLLLALPGAPGTARFVHGSLVRALTRRALRAGLARSLHAGLAEMLSRRWGSGAPTPSAQARRLRHLIGAEELDKAVDLALTAARGRLLAGEPAPARALLRAVEPFEVRLAADDPRRGALWIAQGYAAALGARGPGLRALAARAELEARRRRWPQNRVHALLLLTLACAHQGAGEEAQAAVDEAEALAARIGAPALGALAARERGRALLLVGQPEAAWRALESAAPALEREGPPPMRAEAWRLRAAARWELGDDDGAEAALAQLGEGAAGWTEAEADLLRGALCAARGDRAGARVAWGRAVAAHRALSTRGERSGALLLAGWCLDGADPASAARYLDAAADDQEGGPPVARALYRLLRGRCALQLGRTSTAARWVEDAAAEVHLELRDRAVSATAAAAAATPLAAPGPEGAALRATLTALAADTRPEAPAPGLRTSAELDLADAVTEEQPRGAAR